MSRLAALPSFGFLMLMIIGASPPSAADQAIADANRHALEACAEREIRVSIRDPKLRAKDILRACAPEAEAFFAALPPGLVAEYRKHIEHVIQHRIDQ